MDWKYLISVLLGLTAILYTCHAQDIGRMRRLMLLRQRELALRRGLFPFGISGMPGSGIPPPVATRLALLERQRALGSPFFLSPFGPVSPLLTFGSGPTFGVSSPFMGPSFTLPTDLSRLDPSTLGFGGAITFGDTTGMPSVGPGGATGTEGQSGGRGSTFDQQPTQAAEFIEQSQQTVEFRQPLSGRQLDPPRSGLAPGGARDTTGNPSQLGPLSNTNGRLPQPSSPRMGPRPGLPPRRDGPNSPRFPVPPPGPFPNRGPPPPSSSAGFPGPPGFSQNGPRFQPPQAFPPRGTVFPERGRMPSRPSRQRGPPDRFAPRNGRPSRGRGPTVPRVFPTVPGVVQIPAVSPSTPDQTVGGQPPQGVGFTQTGAGTMSGAVGDTVTGAVGGQFGGTFTGMAGGPVGGGTFAGPVGGSVGPTFTGPVGPSFAGSAGGPIGGTLSGPVTGPIGGTFTGPGTRPVGGPFTAAPGGMFGGPSGRSVGGTFSGPPMVGPGFGLGPSATGPPFGSFPSRTSQGSAIFPSQSAQDPVTRQPGPSFSDGSFPLGSSTTMPMIPGFPNGPAFPFEGGVQFLDPSDQLFLQSSGLATDGISPGTVLTGFPGTGIGSGDLSQIFGPGFGFVGPSADSAGPAFTTTGGQDASQSQNFNIQFRPLPETQPVQPLPGTMPVQPLPQPGPIRVPEIPERQPEQGQMGFSGNIEGGMPADGTLQFGELIQEGAVSGSPSVQFGVTGFQPGIGDGTIKFDTGVQGSNTAATTVSKRIVESSATANGSTEFRVVEVGNIMEESGFIDSGAATSGDVSDQGSTEGAVFQPSGDITAAISSLGTAGSAPGPVDLSFQPGFVTTETKVTTESGDFPGTSASGVDVTSVSTGTSANTLPPDNPFAASINRDFSFFITENNPAPQDMPPITFSAPEPPAIGNQDTEIMTFTVEQTGNDGGSTSGFSTNSVSTSKTAESKTVIGPIPSLVSTARRETVPTGNTADGGFI